MSGPRSTRRAIARQRVEAFVRHPAQARVHAAVVEPAAEETDDTPAKGGIAELWLYGVVGGWWWGFDAETVAMALRDLPDDVDEVRVRVHSPGGNAVDGIAIGNLLRNHPAKMTVVVDGLAASAASVLILGGDDIVMSPGSQIMIHDASVLTYGNAAQLRSDAEWIDKQSRNYAEVYAMRGGTAEERREAMVADGGRGTWYTAAEAIAPEVNLADRIGTVQSVTPPPAQPTADDLDIDDDEMAARAAYDRDVLCHPDAWAAWSSNPGARPAPPKPPTASADGTTTPKGSSVMQLSDAAVNTLKAKLGVTAEDADEATILAALDEVLDEQTEPTPPGTPQTFTPPAGTVLVDADTWATTQAGAQAGAQARTAQLTEHRDRTIQAAIDAGKFAANRREHFEAAWKADPAGTEETIQALQPGLIPVAELGHDTPTGSTRDAALTDAEADAVAPIFGLTPEEMKI
jgi:ATP-dependent protease ClpP protease subunit